DRKDHAVTSLLTEMVKTNTGQLALESLWALNLSGGFNEKIGLETLAHQDPFVRLWIVRLLCDEGTVSAPFAHRLASLAATEPNVEVRAQLACSARRLPAIDALPIVRNLLARPQHDPQNRLPLFLSSPIASH